MHKFLRKMLIVMTLSAFFFTVLPAPVFAEVESEIPADITAHMMAWDAFIVRPVGFASVVICAGIFAVTLPFAVLGGNTDVAFEKLVESPVMFTFGRALGDF